VNTLQIKPQVSFKQKGNARKGSFTHRAWSDHALLCVSDHAVANPAQNNDIQHEFSTQSPEGKGPP